MPTSIRDSADSAVDPPVRGFLHTPETSNGAALVLTHGAGGNAQAPLLRALVEAFTAAGFTVLRCNLPYRQARSFGPPGPSDAARDRAGLKNAIACMKKILRAPTQNGDAPLLADFARDGKTKEDMGAPSLSRSLRQGGDVDSASPANGWGKVYLGGHSYGGRQSSMLCAELSAASDPAERDLVSGLLLLSYPLHPPRRPEQQRTQHLPDLRTPTLFVHGTRDPFGSIPELERAIKMIPAPTKLLAVEGAGHDLGFKGKGTNAALPAQILAEFAAFFGLSSDSGLSSASGLSS